MDSLDKFCEGSAEKYEKFYFLKQYMSKSPILDVKMLEDKKMINSRNYFLWISRFIMNFSLGLGYAYVYNIFRKNSKVYYIFPVITFCVLGYYDYWNDQYEKYKLIDKYEIQIHRFFCK